MQLWRCGCGHCIAAECLEAGELSSRSRVLRYVDVHTHPSFLLWSFYFSGMELTGRGRFPADHVTVTEACEVVEVVEFRRHSTL